MRLHDIFTLLDFLSRAMAVLLAIAGVVGFAFHKAIEAWIDTRFKAKADEALEGYKAQLAESLESKKAELARQLEEQKARLARDLERDKQSFTEGIRREAYEFDKNRSYYETFDLEFGTVISELYALHADYITKDPNNPLVAQWRDIWLSRSHAMLIEADKSYAPWISTSGPISRFVWPSCSVTSRDSWRKGLIARRSWINSRHRMAY